MTYPMKLAKDFKAGDSLVFTKPKITSYPISSIEKGNNGTIKFVFESCRCPASIAYRGDTWCMHFMPDERLYYSEKQ